MLLEIYIKTYKLRNMSELVLLKFLKSSESYEPFILFVKEIYVLEDLL